MILLLMPLAIKCNLAVLRTVEFEFLFHFIAGVSVMAMRTHVMNTMAQDAPAKTTLRPPPVSAALRVTGKTATGNRYTHARDNFKYGRSVLPFRFTF